MNLTEVFKSIADAIRGKTGKEDKLTPAQMVSEIEGLQIGSDKSTGLLDGTATTFENHELTKLRMYAFYGNTVIKTIVLPNVTTLTSGANKGEHFNGCTSLTTVKLPLVTTISFRAFRNTALNAYDFSPVTSIGNWAFNATNLTQAVLPKVTTILDNAFNACSKLTKVDASVLTKIGYSAFASCSTLDTVILRKNAVATLDNVNAFSSTPIAKGTGYIYVSSAVIEQYKVATNWINYADQFRAIEDYPEICGGGAE